MCVDFDFRGMSTRKSLKWQNMVCSLQFVLNTVDLLCHRLNVTVILRNVSWKCVRCRILLIVTGSIYTVFQKKFTPRTFMITV